MASPADTAWFTQARFGLFVHFGLFSTPARHEWVMSYEQIPVAEYEKYAEFFDPDRFDARELARTAREAGMQYAVLVTKHHEGFALWGSQVSDYTSMHTSGRDLVAEFAHACRAEGLRVGFYYSLIDWHHPDFTIDANHPRREDPNVAEQNATKNMDRYRAYLHAQVRELLTNYGQVDYLFYDFTYPNDRRHGLEGKGPQDWDSETLLNLTRELQPGIVVNDRLGIPGDLVTPEQYQPDAPMQRDGAPVPWEACHTTNGSWGYDRDNHSYKSADLLVRMLADSVAKGGNVLLNVGPDGRGAISPKDRTILAQIGDWMDLHAGSIIGAGPAAWSAPSGTVLTQRDDRLYLHLLTWPFGHVHLANLAGSVRFARFLHDGSEVARTETDPDQQAWNTTPSGQAPGTLTLTLPTVRPDVLHPVIELFLAPTLHTDTPSTPGH